MTTYVDIGGKIANNYHDAWFQADTK